MKDRRVLTPVIISIITGLILVVAVVAMIIITANQPKTSTTVNNGAVVGKIANATSTLPVVRQVIGANLQVTGNLNTQSIVTTSNISADSITSKNTVKASSITFAKTSGATAANQLYVMADGSLNYYDGAKRTNLTGYC
jgi:hypothetical protein